MKYYIVKVLALTFIVDKDQGIYNWDGECITRKIKAIYEHDKDLPATKKRVVSYLWELYQGQERYFLLDLINETDELKDHKDKLLEIQKKELEIKLQLVKDRKSTRLNSSH